MRYPTITEHPSKPRRRTLICLAAVQAGSAITFVLHQQGRN